MSITHWFTSCRLRALLLCAAAGFAPAQAQQNNDALQKIMEERLSTKLDSVVKVPYGELYEVRGGTNIVYTDAKGEYLFVGNVIDLAKKENLTKKRVDGLVEAARPKVAFDDLPLGSAIKIVKGNGERRIAVFEDPNCIYCKRFEQGLKEITDVTVYVILYPILGQDSVNKSKAIWCAQDRVKAWTDWMVSAKQPAIVGECDTPLDKNIEYGRKIGVDGTPTVFFANGKRVEGFVTPQQLGEMLAKNAK